jgi:hypothetical protein
MRCSFKFPTLPLRTKGEFGRGGMLQHKSDAHAEDHKLTLLKMKLLKIRTHVARCYHNTCMLLSMADGNYDVARCYCATC